MKTCLNCATENPDDALTCQSCGTTTFVTSSPEAIGGHLITPAEKRFWERMTFRQFALLIIRMQALWFLVYVAIDITYLPQYFTKLHSATYGITEYAQARQSVFLALLRILMNAAGAMICIQCAENILSWLVKDLIPKSKPDLTQEPKPTERPDETTV
jgi:hypothetical protein